MLASPARSDRPMAVRTGGSAYHAEFAAPMERVRRGTPNPYRLVEQHFRLDRTAGELLKAFQEIASEHAHFAGPASRAQAQPPTSRPASPSPPAVVLLSSVDRNYHRSLDKRGPCIGLRCSGARAKARGAVSPTFTRFARCRPGDTPPRRAPPLSKPPNATGPHRGCQWGGLRTKERERP
jgi:hypothetical protein